mmetsp:Transcript_9860/g.30115  ORF Transcript_9860/g.30115 Transcript_9860/m.30115 type:complete len:247 (+) Transcript_9860:1468-2208(+)
MPEFGSVKQVGDFCTGRYILKHLSNSYSAVHAAYAVYFQNHRLLGILSNGVIIYETSSQGHGIKPVKQVLVVHVSEKSHDLVEFVLHFVGAHAHRSLVGTQQQVATKSQMRRRILMTIYEHPAALIECEFKHFVVCKRFFDEKTVFIVHVPCYGDKPLSTLLCSSTGEALLVRNLAILELLQGLKACEMYSLPQMTVENFQAIFQGREERVETSKVVRALVVYQCRCQFCEHSYVLRYEGLLESPS